MQNEAIQITFYFNDDENKRLETRDAMIGVWDGESNDDDVFYWFDDDGSELVGDHGDFTVVSVQKQESVTVNDEEDGWKVSDPSCRQKFKKLDENRYLYREDRISNPETKETYVYESVMDFSDYDEDDLEKGVEAYYKNLDEVKSIYGDDWKQIVLECIFEQD